MSRYRQELVLRPEDYLRPLRALTREVVRAARADAAALLPLARALAQPPPHEPAHEVRVSFYSLQLLLFHFIMMANRRHLLAMRVIILIMPSIC